MKCLLYALLKFYKNPFITSYTIDGNNVVIQRLLGHLLCVSLSYVTNNMRKGNIS